MTTTVPTALIEYALHLPAPARMLTTNRERTLHWSYRAEIARAWRHAAKVTALANHAPHFAAADLEVRVYQARGRLADAEAYHPVTKAIIDGLVDARVLPDDGPAYVRSIAQHAPVRGENGVSVVVRGELMQDAQPPPG